MRKRATLENLYKQYARPLYFYLLKLSGSEQLAEDLTQETFVRATIALHTYEGEEARAWLFKVARNAFFDEWRKRQRRKTVPLLSFLGGSSTEMLSPYGLPENELLEKEAAEEIADLLAFLPENYRSVLYLREYEGFSYREIMDTLQLTESQVKVTLHRARQRLRQLAEKKGWDYDRVE